MPAPLAFARPRLIRTGKWLDWLKAGLEHDLRRVRVRPATLALTLTRLGGAIPAALADTATNVSEARRDHSTARQAPALPGLRRAWVRRDRLHADCQHHLRGGFMGPFDWTRA